MINDNSDVENNEIEVVPEEKEEVQEELLTTSDELGKMKVDDILEKESEGEDEEASDIDQIREEIKTKEEVEEVVVEEPSSIEDYVLNSIPNKYKRNRTAKKELTGDILLKITDIKESYFLEFTSQGLKVEKKEAEAKCTISFDEGIFNQLIKRTINPQIALLTKKIKIEGNVSNGMYFFNLFS